MSTFTGRTWGAVLDITVHAPASKVQAKEETDKVAQATGADKSVMSVMVARIPADLAKRLANAGANVRGFVKQHAIHINGQMVIPIPMLPTVWKGIFGHDDLSSMECVGSTALMCKYNAIKAGLLDLCRSGELDRIIAEKAGGLANQISRVDCATIDNAYNVEIRLDIDCNSQAVQDALNQLSENVRVQVQAKAAAEAELSAGQAVNEITQYAVAWIEETLGKVIGKATAAEKGTQYAGLVDMVQELVDRLPAYNLTNDPKVTAAIKSIRERLSSHMDAENMRRNEYTRKSVIDAARSILADLNPTAAAAPAPVEESPAAVVEDDPLSKVILR